MATANPSPTQQLQSVRLEVMTATSQLSAIREISEIIVISLELGTPVWDNILPTPRAPLEVQIDRVAKQHVMHLRDSQDDKIYVRAVGVVASGEERTVGVAIWQKPGVRYHTLNLEELSEDDKEGFKGYDMVFRDAFYGGFQHYRDKLMSEEPYWYVFLPFPRRPKPTETRFAGISRSLLSTQITKSSRSAANSLTMACNAIQSAAMDVPISKRDIQRFWKLHLQVKDYTRAEGLSRRMSTRWLSSTQAWKNSSSRCTGSQLTHETEFFID